MIKKNPFITFIIEKFQRFINYVKCGIIKFLKCVYNHRLFYIRNLLVIALALIVILAVNVLSYKCRENVPDQNSQLVWGGGDYAMVSCYTSIKDRFSQEEIMRLEYEINKTLKENGDGSIKATNRNNEKEIKKWTDGYSAKGYGTVINGNASVDGIIYGVGNDFFSLHPLTLLSGGYINTDNVMKDYIMLDEEAAWQLFGSNDVAGLFVTINGEKYVVSGVYKRPDNKINDASGNGEITFYVNYEALEKIDGTTEITDYEVIMTNPIKHYAYDYICKYFIKSDEKERENTKRDIFIVENSDRYSVEALWKHLKGFGINAMDLDEIVYPFWENVARAYEDILSVFLLINILAGTVILLAVVVMAAKTGMWVKNSKA